MLRPTNAVSEVNAVLLSGGSAFGLDAASGVMLYLEEKGFGHRVGEHVVPIVPAAILFDLGLVTGAVRPGPDDGYAACLDATSGRPEEGSVGAGTGATVAKLLGARRAVKGGVGTANVELGDGLVVGAIVAVNAVGGVVEPETGQLIAGPRSEDGTAMLDSTELMTSPTAAPGVGAAGGNTTLGSSPPTHG